jgi:hypothetical protein
MLHRGGEDAGREVRILSSLSPNAQLERVVNRSKGIRPFSPTCGRDALCDAHLRWRDNHCASAWGRHPPDRMKLLASTAEAHAPQCSRLSSRASETRVCCPAWDAEESAALVKQWLRQRSQELGDVLLPRLGAPLGRTGQRLHATRVGDSPLDDLPRGTKPCWYQT